MSKPDELADALWKVTDPAPNFDTTRGFSLAELRTLARAAAKAALLDAADEYDGLNDADYDPPNASHLLRARADQIGKVE